MCGEWKFSMLLAYTFATFHRFTAISYKVPAVEVMAGIAAPWPNTTGWTRWDTFGKSWRRSPVTWRPCGSGQRSAKDPVMYGDIAVPIPYYQHGQTPLRRKISRVRETHPGHLRRDYRHHADKSDWHNQISTGIWSITWAARQSSLPRTDFG